MKPPQPYATVVANGSCQLMKRATVHSSQAFRDVAGVETTTNQPPGLSEIGTLKRCGWWLLAVPSSIGLIGRPRDSLHSMLTADAPRRVARS
jgi:hypothetical protein